MPHPKSSVQIINSLSPGQASRVGQQLVTGACGSNPCPTFADSMTGLKMGSCGGSCACSGGGAIGSRESASAAFGNHAGLLAPCGSGEPSTHPSMLRASNGAGAMANATTLGGVGAQHAALQATMPSVGCAPTFASTSKMAAILLQTIENKPGYEKDPQLVSAVKILNSRVTDTSQDLATTLTEALDSADSKTASASTLNLSGLSPPPKAGM
jgi:hypothetical protein